MAPKHPSKTQALCTLLVTLRDPNLQKCRVYHTFDMDRYLDSFESTVFQSISRIS